MSPEFRVRLEAFLEPFERYRGRVGRRLLDPADYPRLPQTPPGHAPHEWRLRRYDLGIVRRYLKRRESLAILDVGAWNGWLSNHLTSAGHDVTAVDYFVDEYDGLCAQRHYENSWRMVQMDLEDLSILRGPFDMVIFNRCMQYFIDPQASLQQARFLLVPGGLLLCTGLQFLRDPSQRAAELDATRRELAHEGIVYFKSMRGYLDFDDRRRMHAWGLQMRTPWQLMPANMKATARPTWPWYAYGTLYA